MHVLFWFFPGLKAGWCAAGSVEFFHVIASACRVENEPAPSQPSPYNQPLRFSFLSFIYSESIRWRNFTKYLFLGVYGPYMVGKSCSYRFLRKLSWKIWCVLVHFASPGKFTCVLVPFFVFLENFMCSYRRVMSSPRKFLLHPSLLENLMCSRNLFKKVAPGKKEQISPAASDIRFIFLSNI